MDFQTELTKLAVEAYDRGLRAGAQATVEGIEKMVEMGLVTMKPELLQAMKESIPRILDKLTSKPPSR